MNNDKKDNNNVLEAMDNLIEFLDLEPKKKGEILIDENGIEYTYQGSEYFLWDLRKNDKGEFINLKDYPTITPGELVKSEPLDYPHEFEKTLVFESDKHMVRISVGVEGYD